MNLLDSKSDFNFTGVEKAEAQTQSSFSCVAPPPTKISAQRSLAEFSKSLTQHPDE